MRSTEWSKRALLVVPVVLAAAGLSGCKSLSERYIRLEVWKYEKCFGHLPPGFTPPGAQDGWSPNANLWSGSALCGPVQPLLRSLRGGEHGRADGWRHADGERRSAHGWRCPNAGDGWPSRGDLGRSRAPVSMTARS